MAIVFVLRPHTLHSWCPSPVNGLDVCEVPRRATKILGEGRGGEGKKGRGEKRATYGGPTSNPRKAVLLPVPFVWSCMVTKLTLYLPEVINI